jgi:Zn-dependent protease
VGTAVAFFASLLAHELGHAVVARRAGLWVEGSTLWLLGGVAKLDGEAANPRAELGIAAVGPLISLVLAAVAASVAAVSAVAGLPRLVVASVAWLARINLLLAIFNLLPAAPLDGGCGACCGGGPRIGCGRWWPGPGWDGCWGPC